MITRSRKRRLSQLTVHQESTTSVTFRSSLSSHSQCHVPPDPLLNVPERILKQVPEFRHPKGRKRRLMEVIELTTKMTTYLKWEDDDTFGMDDLDYLSEDASGPWGTFGAIDREKIAELTKGVNPDDVFKLQPIDVEVDVFKSSIISAPAPIEEEADLMKSSMISAPAPIEEEADLMKSSMISAPAPIEEEADLMKSSIISAPVPVDVEVDFRKSSAISAPAPLERKDPESESEPMQTSGGDVQTEEDNVIRLRPRLRFGQKPKPKLPVVTIMLNSYYPGPLPDKSHSVLVKPKKMFAAKRKQ